MVMSKPLTAQSNGAPRNFPEFRYDLGPQLSSGSNYPAAREPEIRLMLMILEDAIACYQRFLNAQNDPALRQFREAERWLLAATKIGYFRLITSVRIFDVDPDYLRGFKANGEMQRR